MERLAEAGFERGREVETVQAGALSPGQAELLLTQRSGRRLLRILNPDEASGKMTGGLSVLRLYRATAATVCRSPGGLTLLPSLQKPGMPSTAIPQYL